MSPLGSEVVGSESSGASGDVGQAEGGAWVSG